MDLGGGGTVILQTPAMAGDAEGLFSPDGGTVAVSYSDPGGAARLALFDVSGRLLSDRRIPLDGRPHAASYSPDGKSLLLVLGGRTAAAVDV